MEIFSPESVEEVNLSINLEGNEDSDIHEVALNELVDEQGQLLIHSQEFMDDNMNKYSLRSSQKNIETNEKKKTHWETKTLN